jgi:hypothetical protein
MLGGALTRATVAGGLCVAALGAASATAAADPTAPPIPDPALLAEVPVGDVPPVVDPFTTTSQVTKQNPLAAFADVLAQASPDVILKPSTSTVGTPDPLASVGALFPKNYRMPTGELPSPYQLATDVEPGPFARVDGWKGLHAMLHGALGRMPGAELGQPLPGTAPPPGTAIPLGLVEFLPDPAELVPAGPAAIILPPVAPVG